MKKEISYNEPAHLRFKYLIAFELLIAGILSAVFAANQGFTTITVVAALIAATSGIGLLFRKQLSRQLDISRKIMDGLQIQAAQFILSVIILFVTALLIITDLNEDVIQVLSPVLICIWLIGVEYLLFFYQENKVVETGELNFQQKRWVLLSLILAIGIVIIPSRVPSFLDGIPLETPFEFILVTLLIPFAFILGGRFFARKSVLFLLGFLFAIKIIALIILPQAGLGVRAYSSEETLANSNWEKSYSTFLNPSYTQVTQIPYYSYREFPIEWINQNGFKPDEFWVALEISGYVHLQQNERLILVVVGAEQTQVEMVDAYSHQTVPAVIAGNVRKVNANLYQEIPKMQDFKLQGTLVYKSFGQYRIEPLILYPDGSTKSALTMSRIWVSNGSASANFFQILLNLTGMVLAGLLMAGLIKGIYDLYRADKINAIDIYLAATALPAFYIARFVPRPNMNVALITFISVLALVKFLECAILPHGFSWKALFISIGPAFLLMFLVLDINNLRDVVIFPQKQDCLEYQILARNIFVNGDVFLAKTPPFAYKVLFPYLAGLLHVFFGQSASALLFLNTWCALLSSVLILKLSDSFGLPARISLPVSISFLLILCMPSNYIYYFRFGLIEPVAILCLLATYYFAINRQIPGMFWAGILTALLRLNFLGAILTAVILTSNPITGMIRIVWKQFFDWIGSHWKLMAIYLLSVVTPSLLIMLGYSLFISNYIASASINNQTSLGSILQSLLIVIVGGDPADLHAKLLANPVDILLISIPVSLGFLIAFTSLIYRNGPFQKIDLRLSLLILSILAIYIVFQPIGYFPRYSWSPLPLALIIIGLLLSGLFYKNEQSA